MQKQNITLIVPARFIALDSSILGNLAKDYFSSNAESRKECKEFLNCLDEHALIPLLCFHHFEELIKHREDKVAKDRFNFLRSLPKVTWIAANNGSHLGSIVDILRAECRTALQGNDLSVQEVRDKTQSSLIHFGTGAEAMYPYEEDWEQVWQIMRPFLWEQEKKTREIVAIRRAKVADISKKPISNFMNGTIREQEQLNSLLNSFKGDLTQKIQTYGDKRIPNPSEVSSHFYDEMAKSDEAFHLKNGGLQEFLNYHDIDIEELGPNAFMGDIFNLIDFRSKLKIAYEYRSFNMPWESFKKSIRPQQIPSWVIQNALYSNSQEQLEYKGSELTDHYLACLSPYVDLIYVDKRMKNDFLRASQKNSVFCNLLNKIRIEKDRPYKRIQEQIEAIDF